MSNSGDTMTLFRASSSAGEVIFGHQDFLNWISRKITTSVVAGRCSSEDVPSLLANNETALPLYRQGIVSQLHSSSGSGLDVPQLAKLLTYFVLYQDSWCFVALSLSSTGRYGGKSHVQQTPRHNLSRPQLRGSQSSQWSSCHQFDVLLIVQQS